MAERPSPVSAVTVMCCGLRRVSGADFLELVRTDLHFSWQVHKIQSLLVQHQLHRLADLSGASVRVRLERLIRQMVALDERVAAAREARLSLPLKRCEIAQLIAVRPEHLSRVLKQLQDEGVIHVRKGWIVIPDIERLLDGEWHDRQADPWIGGAMVSLSGVAALRRTRPA